MIKSHITYFRKVLQLNKQNYILILIIVIGILFRFIGIYPGYPRHTDEGGYSSTVVMLWNATLDPGRYDYPSGVPIIHFILFKFIFIPLSWGRFFIQHAGLILDGLIKIPITVTDYRRILKLDIIGERELYALYWGRYVTAAFGVGIIILIYKLSSQAFGKRVGLLSAFLVAVNFRQVLNSHIGLPDIYNGFFLSLALLFIVKLYKRPSKKLYALAGLASAWYFCIKFQVFTIPSFVLAHVLSQLRQHEKLTTKLKKILLSPKMLLGMLIFAFVVILLNPYILQNIELFRDVQTYQLAKYGSGAYSWYIYPLDYLYKIGIGEILTILTLIGILIGIIKYTSHTLILLLAVFSVMFTFVYYSHGGFYTRNFVTITPFILIFAAITINEIFLLTNRIHINRYIGYIILLSLVFVANYTNIARSLVVNQEYSKPWNEQVTADWVKQHIPANAHVAAHGNTPIPQVDVIRSSFETDLTFSVDEFKKEGAEWAISNSAWATNSFYWWMSGDATEYLNHYWDKPLAILEYSYPAIALRELSQFAVFSVMNRWEAPDVDFLVAKLPKYKIISQEIKQNYNFRNDTDGWKVEGNFWTSTGSFAWEKGGLVIKKDTFQLPSARWESPPISVNNWPGFIIKYKAEATDQDIQGKAGYIFVSFYSSEEDALNSQNRIGVRLSRRIDSMGIWEDDLVGQVPNGSEYIRISFSSYCARCSESTLRTVSVYKADIKTDFGGVEVHPYNIDQNNLFPNSHGNL